MDKQSGKKNDPANDHTVSEIDEYDLYYGENAIDETGAINDTKPGPLSRRPSLLSALPPLALSMLFIFCTFSPSGSRFSDLLWASREAVYTKHEYWRLITALFTHAGSEHLISNMPFFILFGLFLYEYFGFMLFPVLSVLNGIAANAFTLYFYQGSVRLIGASGMVYGMVSLWLVLYIYHDTDRTILIRFFRAIGFALIVFFPETYNPSTSYLAHASGFLSGIVSALIMLPFISVKNREMKKNSADDRPDRN